MGSSLSKGNLLGGKYSPGLLDIWILGSLEGGGTNGEISSVTVDGTSGEITEIAGTGTFRKFQCAPTSGQFVEGGTAAEGGREVNQTATYRFVGNSKAQRDIIEELAEQSRLKVVAQYRGSKDYWLFGEDNGLTMITDDFDSGVGGGGAGAIGTTVVFQGAQLNKANKLAAALSATAQTPITVE